MGRGPASRKFKRGPTNPTEHARRVAWGKLWGQRIKKATEQWKRELQR